MLDSEAPSSQLRKLSLKQLDKQPNAVHITCSVNKTLGDLSVLGADAFVLSTPFDKKRALANLGIVFGFVINICISNIWKLISVMKLNPLIGI